jgi:phosphate transport system substrate-binding protein
MKSIVLSKPKTLKHKLHAVSPVVATLILIVVAIVGAIAVGLIVSNVANNTSHAATVSGVSSGASGTLTIGGSTTIYPVTSSAVAAFEAEYPGINVQVAQGGSGAGMEGVIIGAIDIGEASSFPTVSSYSVSAAAQNPPVNLVATNIGGSGVVVIENTPIVDGTPDTCYGVTSGAMALIYTYGTFYLSATACGAATHGYLTTAGVFAAAQTGGAGPYVAVSRSDIPSGTQETFGAWMGFSSTQQDESQFGSATATGLTEVGNPGVLATVENTANTIGFVDVGFAEQQTLLKAAVFIPALTTTAGQPSASSVVATSDATTTINTPVDCATGTATATSGTVPTSPTSDPLNCYALKGESTSKIDTTIKNALSGAGPNFPDNTAAAADQLARTFWLVTNGPATAPEQDFINFLTNPGSSTFFTNQGYYSVYQYKTG